MSDYAQKLESENGNDFTTFVTPDGKTHRGAVILGRDGQPFFNPTSSYGEPIVAQLFPVFQYSFEYTVDNTDLTENTVANGGTITQAEAMAVVRTSTTTASSALLESFRHAKYRAGIGGLIRFTALFTSPVAGTEQYAGAMDTTGVVSSSAAFNNGYAIGYDGTTFGYHRFQNDSKITVAQADWNIDNMLGTGGVGNLSGLTLDHTKLNVYSISYQYLGAGAICIFVENQNTGRPIMVHADKYANLNTSPSVHNPNFHFMLWVNNGATTSDLIIKSGSFAYFSEGRTSFIETQQPQNSSGLITKTDVTTEVAIFTIRNRANYAGKINFIDIVLENILGQIEASAANNLGSIRLVKNTTLGGDPSYSDINTNNSVVEIDTAGTTLTGGKELALIPLAGKNDKDNLNLTPFRIFLKHNESLTVAGLSDSTAIIRAATLWREMF